MNTARPLAWLAAISLAALAQPALSAAFGDAPHRPAGTFHEVTLGAAGPSRPATRAPAAGITPASGLAPVRVPDVPTPRVDASVPDMPAQPRAAAPTDTPVLAVIASPAPEPPRAETPADPGVVPAAPVTILPSDVLGGAIELQLGDAKSKLPRRVSHKDLEALASFYASVGYRPVWIEGGGWTGKARAILARLRRADEDGLAPGDYSVPDRVPAAATPAEIAQAEIRLSAAAFLYARDAWGGRVDPMRLSSLIARKLDPPTPGAVLAGLAEASDLGAVLEGYNPSYPGYLALKEKLAELRARAPSAPSVRLKRGREAVLSTQAIAVLDDGPPLGSRAVGRAEPHLLGDVIANMERWRWLPHDVPQRYIAVNIPEFRLRVVDHGRVVHEARVITGKPDTPTPIFSDEIQYAIINPSWYIPPSIMKKEILPGLAADPNYAAKRGYQVIRHGRSISVRQPPGERNALGFIKFMFPNNYAVYLHDTPNRSLFHAARRAFSHGCVRVDDPFALADQVLGSAWSEARLRRLIGHGERTIRLPEKLPVQLTYFTTAVDEFGELRNFEDLYGYNRKLRVALGL